MDVREWKNGDWFHYQWDSEVERLCVLGVSRYRDVAAEARTGSIRVLRSHLMNERATYLPDCTGWDWQPAPPTKWIDVTAENWMQHWGKPVRSVTSTGEVLGEEIWLLCGFIPPGTSNNFPVRVASGSSTNGFAFAQVEVPA